MEAKRSTRSALGIVLDQNNTDPSLVALLDAERATSDSNIPQVPLCIELMRPFLPLANIAAKVLFIPCFALALLAVPSRFL